MLYTFQRSDSLFVTPSESDLMKSLGIGHRVVRKAKRIAQAAWRLRLPPKERYAAMQKAFYDDCIAPQTEEEAKNRVIGEYKSHQAYPYEELLLAQHRKLGILPGRALDFGCGPGRMILRMQPLCKQVDGTDISEKGLGFARQWTEGLPTQLFLTNGYDLSAVSSDTYELVYSTIALQHIPVHETRMGLFREFLRVLKPGGRIALQMAYSDKPAEQRADHAEWTNNRYNVQTTNAGCDVLVTPAMTQTALDDLQRIGFQNVEHALHPVPHPSDIYTRWIFFYGQKP